MASRRAGSTPVAAQTDRPLLPLGSPRVIAGSAAEPSSRAIEPTATLPAETGDRPRIIDIVSGTLQVRLADNAADIDAAQALRYRIFYEIMGARPLPGMEHQRRDRDG